MFLNTIKNKLLTKGVGFYASELRKLIIKDGAVIVTNNLANNYLPIIIISRQHYNVEHQKYPVEQQSQLEKIIKLEHSIDGKKMSYVIGDFDGENRTVTFFSMKEQAITLIENAKPIVVIPDILLLGAQYNNQLIDYHIANKHYWVLERGGVIFSTLSNALIKNKYIFANSIGYNLEENSEQVSLDDSTVKFELKVLIGLFFSRKVFAFKVKTEQTIKVSGKSLLTFSAAFSAAFILAQLAFIQFYNISAVDYKEKNQQLQSDVTEVLAIRKSGLETAKLIESIQSQINGVNVDLTAWALLKVVSEQAGAELINFSMYNNQGEVAVNLMAKAPRATDILKLLSNNPNVLKAEFSSDVVTTKEGDSFQIKATLVGNQ